MGHVRYGQGGYRGQSRSVTPRPGEGVGCQHESRAGVSRNEVPAAAIPSSHDQSQEVPQVDPNEQPPSESTVQPRAAVTAGRPRRDDTPDQMVVDLRAAGGTWAQIAAVTGLTVPTVRHRHRRAIDAGVTATPTGPAPSRHDLIHQAACVRLDPIADDLMTALAAGGHITTVCDTLGVTVQSVRGRAAWDPAWSRRLDQALMDGRDESLPHGTPSTYARGCRCPECLHAHRDQAGQSDPRSSLSGRDHEAQWGRATRSVLAGATYRSAAAEHGVSERSLRDRMRANGIAPARRRGQRAAVPSDDAVLRLHSDGWTMLAIADELGVSITSIRNALDRLGVTRLTRMRRADSRREVTDDERRQLRRLVATPGQASPELVTLVAALARDGVPMTWIDRAVGRTSNWARTILVRHGRLPDLRPTHIATAEARARAVIRWAREMTRPGTAVILDTETTGLEHPEVIEVAVIDAATGATLLNQRVRPVGQIEPDATAVHGITSADLVDAPSWSEVAPLLAGVCAERTVLAWNADYDEAAIRRSDTLAGLTPYALGTGWHCVMRQEAASRIDDAWHRLAGDHTALGDCHAVRRELLRLSNDSQP